MFKIAGIANMLLIASTRNSIINGQDLDMDRWGLIGARITVRSKLQSAWRRKPCEGALGVKSVRRPNKDLVVCVCEVHRLPVATQPILSL